MATVIVGQYSWEGDRDSEGHRSYEIVTLVLAALTDGPAAVLATPGLPYVGEIYTGFGLDFDMWAWCRPDAKMTPLLKGEPNQWWYIKQTFSTKPPDKNKRRCQNLQIEDPILEPPKVNGECTTFTQEVAYDRFGNALVNSAWEQVRGPQAEFDFNKPSDTIDLNVANYSTVLLAQQMMNTVNDDTLWGKPARCVKLSSVNYEKKYEGACNPYYTLKLKFDTNLLTWDRDLLDEGTKILNGHWDPTTGAWTLDNINGQPPNPANPQHFIRFKDRNGENIKGVLNGAGLPAATAIAGNCQVSCLYFGRPSAVNIQVTFTNELGYTSGIGLGATGVSLLPSGSMSITQLTAGSDVSNEVQLITFTGSPTGGTFKLIFSQPPASGLTTGAITYSTSPYTLQANIQAALNALAPIGGSGSGSPAGNIHVEYYPESDFTLLGIPITL